VLDHDDTVVDSTKDIHFPAFIEYLKINRPSLVNNYTLESYLEKNFSPGILSLLMDELGLTEQEIKDEEHFWSDFVKSHVPHAYSGISEIIAEFRARGGIIAVSSHSLTRYIERDYRENGLPFPDRIFGWDIPKEERKPAPHTVLSLIKEYKLSPNEVLVVDDLKPGFDMARSAGVVFAAAGWAYNVPKIESFMRENCDYYLKTVSELCKLLFE
jgi:phosphoglycolate phosphatase/pyrophosphatase PpaX